MSDVAFYFETGWHHIISWDALDHILFLIALVAIYQVQNWKQLLVLITAFTIGHSLTLALSVYDIVRFSEKWVEFLIPSTIIATAIFNFFAKKFSSTALSTSYFLALFFGLIHGMGFANTIRFMLADNQSIAGPLLSFNIGLEVGQLAVVGFILLLNYILIGKFRINRQWWVATLSSIAAIIALKMAIERWPL